jgi:predicted CxxxxCH...CXXCH cytochrome family protein
MHTPNTLRVGLVHAWLVASCAGVLACQTADADPDDNANCNQPALTCTTCHGDPATGDPAPPTDTAGSSDTAAVTVGAHQSHLTASAWHAPVGCADCHVVPTAVNAPGHIDGGDAELVWSALATADGATPLFDRTAATCAGVYCHGTTLVGGGAVPQWTVVDGSQAACGTCHGLPPAAPHPQSSDCESCHGMVVNATGGFVDPALHINGQLNVQVTSCSGCHGSVDNAAPPVDTMGRSDTAEVTVGAHQAHLAMSSWHRQVQCDDCHTVPTSVGDAGHIDAAPAELTWGTLATADSANPAFDRGAATCDGVYCHGTTLLGPATGGTVARTPVWTTVDGTWDSCGDTCHTTPPGGTHPVNDQCQVCHSSVISSFDPVTPANTVWTDPSRHINGSVNF